MKKNLKEITGSVDEVKKQKTLKVDNDGSDVEIPEGELNPIEPFTEEEPIVRKEPRWMWPTNPRFVNAYKYFMMVHSGFLAFFWVFRISFEGKPLFAIVLLEFYYDLVFTVDIIRILRTPFINESGKLVTAFKPIAYRYLWSWLLFDLYSYFPLALFRYNSNRADGGYNDIVNLMKFNFERLPRFYKIMLMF
mmetsp:Transcript_21875/g.33922  ORF Transcript_21875/g.33922 Transcript_21875/m.33922 type:complete len:192 (+) Transcript_21875:107-682(+)